jgi:hypothetical protein
LIIDFTAQEKIKELAKKFMELAKKNYYTENWLLNMQTNYVNHLIT